MRSSVGPTSQSAPPCRKGPFASSPTMSNGTGFVVWAVCGPSVVGSIISSQLPWSAVTRSEEHTSELQSPCNLVCRLLLEKKKTIHTRAGAVIHPRHSEGYLPLAGQHPYQGRRTGVQASVELGPSCWLPLTVLAAARHLSV